MLNYFSSEFCIFSLFLVEFCRIMCHCNDWFFYSSLGDVQQSSPLLLQFPICKCHHTFSGCSFYKMVLHYLFYFLFTYLISYNTHSILNNCLLHVGFRWFSHLLFSMRWNPWRWFLSQVVNRWAVLTIQQYLCPLGH